MVTEQDAKEILMIAAKAGITVFLDGGWGVDALVGHETRAHNDIDLFAQAEDYACLIELISAQGFSEIATSFTAPGHSVWKDALGRIIDLHRFACAGDGRILYGGEAFPGTVFSGRGTIGGLAVKCIEPASQLMFHLGYQHDEDDVHDVLLLCKTFGFDIPEEYRQEWDA